MSTAPSEALHSIEHDDRPAPGPAPQHLRAVPERTVQVAHTPSICPTDVRQRGLLDHPVINPQEEYSPSPDIAAQRATVMHLWAARTANPADARFRDQLTAIKRMTRTIGWAFMESELGIRPFAQLSSWIELELFQKLRARVIHAAANKHLAARRGEDASRKIPQIVPIGVRASLTANGDWETSMTIKVGQRARALAMRLQLHRNRWRVIALEVG